MLQVQIFPLTSQVKIASSDISDDGPEQRLGRRTHLPSRSAVHCRSIHSRFPSFSMFRGLRCVLKAPTGRSVGASCGSTQPTPRIRSAAEHGEVMSKGDGEVERRILVTLARLCETVVAEVTDMAPRWRCSSTKRYKSWPRGGAQAQIPDRRQILTANDSWVGYFEIPGWWVGEVGGRDRGVPNRHAVSCERSVSLCMSFPFAMP